MRLLMKICHKLYQNVYIRWYKFLFQCKVGKVGNPLGINGPLTVINPQKLTLGNNCSLNHGCYINCFNPVEIGNDVTISAGVTIVSTGIDYRKWFATGKREHIKCEKLTIADHVWIGAGATILQGGNITGNFVVVAANATVCNEINESYCVVAGSPAKVIKRFSVTDIDGWGKNESV